MPQQDPNAIPKLVGEILSMASGDRMTDDKSVLVLNNPQDPNSRSLTVMKLSDLINQTGYVVNATTNPTAANTGDANGAFPIGTLWINRTAGTFYRYRGVVGGTPTWDVMSANVSVVFMPNTTNDMNAIFHHTVLANVSNGTNPAIDWGIADTREMATYPSVQLEDPVMLQIRSYDQVYFVPAITNPNNKIRVR